MSNHVMAIDSVARGGMRGVAYTGPPAGARKDPGFDQGKGFLRKICMD